MAIAELELTITTFGINHQTGEPNAPNPTQQKVLDWVDRVRSIPTADLEHIPVLYLQGGVGAGKTRALMAPVIEMLLEVPNIRVLWGRHDFKDLKLSVMDKFFEVLPPQLIADKSEQYHWYDIHQPEKTKGRIYFNGLKDLSGLGSQEFAVIVVTEAHEISEIAYRTLKRRARQKDGGPNIPTMILMEGEAPNEDHWLARLTDKASVDYDPDIEMMTVSTYENWSNLPKAYTGSLESMPKAWKSKYLLGKFGFQPDGRPYYQGFDETIHAAELEWNPGKELICGWDFGYHHPALLITQIDDQDRWLWLRAILGNDITIHKFADFAKEQINRYYPGARCIHFCDPAAVQKNDKSEDTSWQILASKGITALYRQSEYRARKEIIEGRLATLHGNKPSLMVDSRFCKIAVDGFLGGYHYPQRREDQAFIGKFELPFKDGYYEHVMNAGEYIAVNMWSPIIHKQGYKKIVKHHSPDNI